jgi:hypothetical protein
VSEKQRFYVRTNSPICKRPENIRHNKAVGDNFYRYKQGFRHRSRLHRCRPDVPQHALHAEPLHHGLQSYQQGWDLAGLGFSSDFIKQINGVDPVYLKLPNISVSGYSSLGGVNAQQNTPTDIHERPVNVTNVVGSHTIRFGLRLPCLPAQQSQFGNSRAGLSFDTTWTPRPAR